MNDQNLLHRPTFRPLVAAAGALLLVLAGCQSEPTQPAASAAATTSPATPAASATAAAPGADNAIQMSKCSQPAGGKVTFRVGQSVLVVPAGMVRTAIPEGVTPAMQQADVGALLRSRTAQGGGCPEKPLDTRLLTIGGDFGNSLLAGEVGILAAAPGTINAPFAKITRDLQQKPNKNCKQLNGQMLACVGTETVGNQTTQVMYVVTTDPKRKLVSGGPLAARCVFEQKAIAGCDLVDELPGGIAIDAPLKAGTYSTETLAAAHAAVVRAVDSVRR